MGILIGQFYEQQTSIIAKRQIHAARRHHSLTVVIFVKLTAATQDTQQLVMLLTY